MFGYEEHPETDANGNTTCRFCRFSKYVPDDKDDYGGAFHCTAGDNPGPVVADEAGCEYGERCRSSEESTREQARAV